MKKKKPKPAPAMKERTPKQDWAVAIHETAHAVITLSFGGAIRRDTIDSDGDGGPRVTTYKARWLEEVSRAREPRHQMAMEMEIIACLAGYQAERRVNRRAFRGTDLSDDYEQAPELLSFFVEEGKGKGLWMRLLEMRTKRRVTEYWDRIVFVAQRLREKRTMTGKDARHDLEIYTITVTGHG